jgi:hypothetical protein
MPLTDVFCRNAKPSEKPQKISDGGGLFLLIEPRGSKLWRLAYRFHGKQKTLSLGIYPAVSLKDARDHRYRAKELLARGIDPGEHKKQEKRKKRREAGNTFETVAREWFDAQKAGWTEGYADRILRRLEADVFKVIGRRPINEIEPPELLDAIRQIERRGAIVLARRSCRSAGRFSGTQSPAGLRPAIHLRTFAAHCVPRLIWPKSPCAWTRLASSLQPAAGISRTILPTFDPPSSRR